MKKKLLALCFSLLFALSLAGCAGRGEAAGDGTWDLCATTYPVYLFTCEVVKGVEGVTVTPMVNQAVSCLHDYTLTVKDMKTLEQADVILLSGAGLEESMEDALETVADTPQIDCSENISLLAGEGHDHDHDHGDGDDHDAEVHEDEHDHDAEVREDEHEHDAEAHEDEHNHEDEHAFGHTHSHETDPHLWLDPANAAAMVDNIAHHLSELDPDHSALYLENAERAAEKLTAAYGELQASLSSLPCREMITFHDGFSYFANAFDLEIVRAIEEEAGSEASARAITGIVDEIRFHHLPAIFTEKNGASATAEMIQRECGVTIAQLDLMMSGPLENNGVDTYLTLLSDNIHSILEAYP